MLERQLNDERRDRKAKKLQETTDELSCSLAQGLSRIEQEHEETERKLREADEDIKKVTTITLDDSMDEGIEFNQGINEDNDEENEDETMSDLTTPANTNMAAKKPMPRK